MASSNGGPAFPGADPKDFPGIQGGMTLRDYFAAKAMAAILGHNAQPYEKTSGGHGNVPAIHPVDLAKECYRIAEAMIAEREGYAAQSSE